MRRLICTFVVCICLKQVFSWCGSYDSLPIAGFILLEPVSIHLTQYWILIKITVRCRDDSLWMKRGGQAKKLKRCNRPELRQKKKCCVVRVTAEKMLARVGRQTFFGGGLCYRELEILNIVQWSTLGHWVSIWRTMLFGPGEEDLLSVNQMGMAATLVKWPWLFEGTFVLGCTWDMYLVLSDKVASKEKLWKHW